MSVFGTYGIGRSGIFEQGNAVDGSVTGVQTCWWIKINTKPVRAHMLDGAVFPHIISFTYEVGGRQYTGKRYVSWQKRCPQTGETITVHYDKADPAKYAVRV